VRKDTGPILSCIPSDLRRWINLDGHDLGDAAALDDDDEGTDAPAMSASFLASLDVGSDEWVTDIRPRYNVGRDYREATMGLDVVMVTQVNEQCVLPNVCRNALELQSLEASPAQQRRIGRCELAEVLREVLVCGWRGSGGEGHFGYL